MKKSCLWLFLTVLLGVHGAEWRARVLPRTMLFTQAQLKYTLNPNFNGVQYYSHWTDWPLFIDSSLKEKDHAYRGLQYPDFVRHQEIMQTYGLDGLVYWQDFIRRGTRSNIVEFAKRSPVRNFYLIPQLSSGFDLDKDTPHLLDSPQILRFGDKILMQCYSVRTDEKLIEVKAALQQKYGDKFLFIMRKSVDHNLRKRFHGNHDKLLPADQAVLEKDIRDSLAIADGFGWWNLNTMTEVVQGRREFDIKFYQTLMELTARVMNEPAFRGKMLMAEAVVGHENSSRNGQIQSSKGTAVLRQSLLTALKHGADMISIPEWDEQNENTSLRPTVYNGTAHLRILRYITGKIKGEKLARLPQDDPERPDLILSVRKIITLGEALEFELLNIPDAEKTMPFTLQLNIRNIDGKLLHAFPPYAFDGKDMQEFRPQLPSEKFACERVLLPEVIICRNGKKQIFADGLAAVQIQPTWNSDYKWVKQPLRDLPDAPQVNFTVKPGDSADVFRANAQVTSREILSFAELLVDGDCVYSAGTPHDRSWRENPDFLVFRVGTQSLVQQNVTGTVTVENSVSQWQSGDKQLNYRNYQISSWHRGSWVRIPRGDLDKAVFAIDFPGHISARVSAKDIFDRQSIILSGKKGFNLALTRQLRQYFHPENLNSKTVDFAVDFTPGFHNSVIQLQLIAKNGKIWRSKPILTGTASADTVETVVYSESAEKAVKVNIPANALPDFRYEFSTGRGLIVPVSYGRRQWAIRGGFTDLACMRHCGGDSSGNGMPCGWSEADRLWNKCDDLAPAVIASENNIPALDFSGKGMNLALPQGALPRRSAFTISFEIKPENVQKKQYLISNRQTLPGALDHLWIEKSTLRAMYVNNQIRSFVHDSKLPLLPGQWNKVKVIYDLEHLIFEVNGVKSGKFAAPGPGLYDTATLVGTWKRKPFKGLLRNLRITHAIR